MTDWLPEGHLAWFLLASVEQMDLSAFYGSYRADGWGRAAFEPSMMVSLLLYSSARGSSRGIERKCVEDVAYRVIAAQQKPDHATIARFRARHEDALGKLFSSVLGLCKLGVSHGRKKPAGAPSRVTRITSSDRNISVAWSRKSRTVTTFMWAPQWASIPQEVLAA